MLLQGQFRHDQYMAFRTIAAALEMQRIREADVRTRVTVDPAAQTAAVDTEWRIKFLRDGDNAPLAERTTEPVIKSGSPTPNEFLMCFRAATLEVDQSDPNAANTDAAFQEFLRKIGRAILQIKTGSTEIEYEKRAGYMMTGLPSYGVAQSTLAAGAATGIKQDVRKMQEGADFDDPFLIVPGASLVIELASEGTWVAAHPYILDLTFHGWVALPGTAKQSKKVLTLQEAIAEVQSAGGLDRLKARFNN